jgi:hypothetical protein
MTTTTDPLAGIPITTSITPKKPRVAKPAANAAPVTNLATARAKIKRRKLTGTQFKDLRDQSRSVAGYDDTSPIWGRPTIDVLKEISDFLMPKPGTILIQLDVDRALGLNEELRKRFVSRTLLGEAIENA